MDSSSADVLIEQQVVLHNKINCQLLILLKGI